jgi:protein phosphatase 1 regulatory subunit 10
VSRLVQLMQKFSKKLVSKVVYIKILRASTPQLLDKFLDERGWDLLNYWSVGILVFILHS